jgi:hypothetical protein
VAEATTPAGQAVVTEGGARLNMKMPVEQSGAPPGTFKGVPQEAVTGGLPGGTATGVVTSTRPTATENFGGPIGRPEPIQTSVDSAGQASGLRFRDDYVEHVSKRDFSVPRKRSIGGAYNLNEFNKLDFVHLGNGGQQYVVANQDLTATY